MRSQVHNMAERTPDWLTVREALAHILAHVRPAAAETVSLHDALGRVLAEDIVSPIDHPPWDNSAMDGFAVRAADVAGASRDAPASLTLVGAVAAGERLAGSIAPGTAVAINTGAPIPDGADSVVRIEHTDQWRGASTLEVTAEQAPATVRSVADGPAAPLRGPRIAIFDDADAGKNVRRRGEDLRRGSRVFDAGRRLRPALSKLGALEGSGR